MTDVTTTQSGVPWVERYRPRSLQDVSHQTEVVATLQNAVSTGRLPHLLFYGPPGSGKTSVALALCRQLWHPSQWRRRVLELNASDERGISVVRDKIKHFASLAVAAPTVRDDSDSAQYPNPPFKVIILDEADTVTPDAQAALRRIIEANSRITRFILICNYVTRIIEPLASRCAKFRFQSLPPESMRSRLNSIATAENCPMKDNQLDAILQLAEGDMRRAVQTLQSVHALLGANAQLDDKDIAELAGLPPTHIVDDLLNVLQDKNTNFDRAREAVLELCADGYSAQTLLACWLPRMLELPSETLDELGRAEIAIRIAEAEHHMMDGADEFLQLLTVCGTAMLCFRRTAKRRQ